MPVAGQAAEFATDCFWPTPAGFTTTTKRSFAIPNGPYGLYIRSAGPFSIRTIFTAYGLYSPRSFTVTPEENYSTVTLFARFLG